MTTDEYVWILRRFDREQKVSEDEIGDVTDEA